MKFETAPYFNVHEMATLKQMCYEKELYVTIRAFNTELSE